MFISFFKISLRFLWRKKTYSIINFAGLTFGLSSAIITVLYILNVLSYDKFHKNYNRLYAVDSYVTYFNGDRLPKQYLSASLTDVLKEQAPEIEEMIRISEKSCSFISGDKKFSEQGIYADSNFFSVFTFPMVKSGMNVPEDLNSVAISERMALKLFETPDCIGNTLILKNEAGNQPYKVAGVFEDVPRESLLQFDFVIPFSKFLNENSWAKETGAAANQTWVLLKNSTDKDFVENKIKNLIKNQETTLNQELFLFPLNEQILYRYAGGKRVWKEMQNIVIIGAIGFSILLIACFNFMNLSIALNFRRYREAGIKKAAGSGKRGIIIQFLGETFILTLKCLISSAIIVRILLIGFNRMFNYDIHLELLNFKMFSIILSITLVTGLISGLLPAFYMASVKPIDALKGKIITSNSYSLFRQSLIVFQFTIPVILIICMMIIKTQDSYMRSFDAGVDKEKVIVMDNSKNIQSHSVSYKTELLSIPGIEAVSFTNCIPTRGAKVSGEVTWQGKDASEKHQFWCVYTDFDYNKTVKINIVEGRFFNPSFSTDSSAFIINDVAAGVIKNKNPVGTSITLEGRKGTIIGVIKDFHSIDLAGPVVPTILSIQPANRPTILVKYSSGSFPAITNEIKKVYKYYESETPFKATLFGDLIPYTNLSLPSKLVGIAFIIALGLACMGLFGLASFTAENRTKEIGIRKALGATTLSVMRLLLKSYAKWLIISFVIALPVAFILGKIFLGRFYFHAQMPFWAFLSGPLIAFLVAQVTVSSQTWNIANRNPVKSIRYE